MSQPDPEEVSVSVERHGVSVEKSFEPDDFPVPAIAFVIRSDRDEAVDVRLIDTVPDEINAEDIGFHPKYGADFWHNEEGRLVFEREFEPGEEYTTVYGVRDSDVSRFLGEPEIDNVDPELEEADEGPETVEDVLGEGETLDLGGPDSDAREASDDDLEAAIAAADTPTSDADTETEEPDASDLEAAVSAIETSNGAESEPTTEPAEESVEPVVETEPFSLGDADIVSALAQEIRSGSVAEEDLEGLREALGVADTGSVDARITQLQTEISDLRAYTSALEEFLDENGDAQQLLEELNGSIEQIESELDRVATTAESADSTASEASDAVDEIEATVAEVQSSVQSLDDRLGNVDSSITEVQNDVQSNSSELESVRERVDTVQREVEAAREEIPDGELDGIDRRVGALDDRVESIEDEIQGLAQMREQMASVFGGAAADVGPDEE